MVEDGDDANQQHARAKCVSLPKYNALSKYIIGWMSSNANKVQEGVNTYLPEEDRLVGADHVEPSDWLRVYYELLEWYNLSPQDQGPPVDLFHRLFHLITWRMKHVPGLHTSVIFLPTLVYMDEMKLRVTDEPWCDQAIKFGTAVEEMKRAFTKHAGCKCIVFYLLSKTKQQTHNHVWRCLLSRSPTKSDRLRLQVTNYYPAECCFIFSCISMSGYVLRW